MEPGGSRPERDHIAVAVASRRREWHGVAAASRHCSSINKASFEEHEE
jgi:hypothetical protein